MGKIVVHRGKCTGCGNCVESCPYDLISIENEVVVISDNCRLCGICLSACPFEAIEIVEEEKPEVDFSQYKGILIFGEIKESSAVINTIYGDPESTSQNGFWYDRLERALKAAKFRKVVLASTQKLDNRTVIYVKAIK